MPSALPNIGIFGVGRMGRVHVEHLATLHQTRQVNFVCLGDSHAETTEATLKLIRGTWPELAEKLKIYTSAAQMSLHKGLDGAVVASRTSAHASDCIEFLSQNIPVLVEKPVANTVNECNQLAAVCDLHPDAFIFVAFQRHYDDAGQLARRWVAEGRIGQLQQSHHVIQDKNPTPLGYESCGITADMAIHLVYESLSFRNFELPQSVRALRFNAPFYEDRAHEGANIVHTFLTWPCGSLAHLWGSRLNVTGYDNGFKLIGTLGRIDVGEFVGDFGPISAKLWHGNGSNGVRGELAEEAMFEMRPVDAPGCFSSPPDFYPRYAQGYQNELVEFVRCLRSGERPELSIDIGWKTLLIANAAELSSREDGRSISLLLNGSPIRSIDDAMQLAREVGID